MARIGPTPTARSQDWELVCRGALEFIVQTIRSYRVIDS